MYYSFGRQPREDCPDGYSGRSPELVFEVKSPGDRDRGTRQKAAEYLAAGVLVVGRIDPDAGTAGGHPAVGPIRLYGRADALELTEVFPDFSVPVADLLK
jgi:Uma2 family endonuclease